MRKKYTDELAIRAWVLHESGMIGNQIGKALKVSQDTIYKWIKIVKGNPNIYKQALESADYKKLVESQKSDDKENTLPVGKSYHSIKSFVENYTKEECKKLQDDNAFLRWWNEGERAGWVDRLLHELDKKK